MMCYTKINDFDLIGLFINKDVLWFYISVDNAFWMDISQYLQ